MKDIISKLLSDFRLAKVKLLLMIMAAALSSWGISSVMYGYMMAERDFEVNFGRTFPADIEIVVENYRPGLKDILLADENVIDIERREVLGGRVKNRDDEWMPFTLYGVKDIGNMRLNVFQILKENGNSKNKILIETNALFFLDPKQDSIKVDLADRGKIAWKIGGISHDPRLPPARMEGTVFAHATSFEVLEPFLEEGRRRYLIETDVNTDRREIQKVADRLKATGAKEGSNILIISIPEPGEHIHQNIVDGISFLQESTGVMLSVMGIILLSLILLTWIFPNIRDVGVMKAIGASKTNIFNSYSAVILFIIFIGLLIGIPLGYITAEAYNGIVAFIQNFEPISSLLPLWVHVIVVMSCTVIPFLFTLVPLSKASSTTVKEAMNKTFYTINKSFFNLSQGLNLDSRLMYGINNLFRNTPRTLLAIFLTAVGLCLLFVSFNLEYSVNRELNSFSNSAKYRFRIKLTEEIEKSSIDFIKTIPFVKSILPIKEKLVTYQSTSTAFRETKFLRVLSGKHSIEPEMVIKGKIDKQCRKCLYISGEEMKQRFKNMEIGDEVEISYVSGGSFFYTFSGVLKDMAAIASPFFIFDDGETETINAFAIEVEESLFNKNTSQRIDEILAENGIKTAGVMDVDTRISSLQRHLEPTYFIIKTTGYFTIILGFIGLMIVLSLTIHERTREIGIMKSIGSSFGKISGLLTLEFSLILVFAGGLGSVIAYPITKEICEVIGETVVYHDIPVKNDFVTMGLVIGIVIILQIAVIQIFNSAKINKKPTEFLAQNF